jgi:hypothetical protein
MDLLAQSPDPLGKVIDLAKYLSEPAWNLEGCALVGKQIYELAVAAQEQHRGAVEALRELYEAGLDLSALIGTDPDYRRWELAMDAARPLARGQ